MPGREAGVSITSGSSDNSINNHTSDVNTDRSQSDGSIYESGSAATMSGENIETTSADEAI